MTYPGTPPDAWNDDTGPPLKQPQSIPSKSGEATSRPQLPPEAETLRTAWIAAVRDLHYRRTGKPSNYNSNVQWDGGRRLSTTAKKGYTNFRTPAWLTIVDRAHEAGVSDPVDTVRALFAHWSADTAPTPYALVSASNLESARTFRQARLNRIALARTAEEGVFRMAAWAAGLSIPDPKAAISYVLNDVSRELSPLLRYSLAVLKGLPTVADRWRAAAESQFLQDPGPYLTYWSTLIPSDLQQAAPTAARNSV